MSDDLIAKDQPLSEQARAALAALVGAMIPASDAYGVPGANDPAIFADILTTIAPMLPLLAAATEGLDPASPDLLGEFQASQPDLVPLLVGVVAQCYYRDDRVMASLDMEARPPFPGGFDVEEGDWSLLDPVKTRPPMYREVDERREPVGDAE